MISNIEKYKKDLEKLIDKGQVLFLSLQKESYPDDFENLYKPIYKEKYGSLLKKIVRFSSEYQIWYSETLVLLKQLLPDRVSDFVRLYEKPKGRKTIEYGNYVIEDCLQNLVVTHSWGDRKVGPEAAVSQFEQQLNILKSVEQRFESSLFDIKQLVQADLFDSELDAAQELNKNKFSRAAGAVAGVVLEKHLTQVCDNHNIKITKKDPSISDLNDLLKNNSVIETKDWRFVQHLGDIRNLCDHNKSKEPTKDEVGDLINGVEKITKTIF